MIGIIMSPAITVFSIPAQMLTFFFVKPTKVALGIAIGINAVVVITNFFAFLLGDAIRIFPTLVFFALGFFYVNQYSKIEPDSVEG